jgi:hypothetical protein
MTLVLAKGEGHMAVKNVKQIACYITHDQHTALKALNARTRVPMQEYLREAVKDLLAKYPAPARGRKS